MEKLQTITHPQFGRRSYIEVGGIEYFAANDCALMLGYSVPKDAISRHCKGALKRRLPTKGGQQEIKFIPESDLWRLIIRSKLPQAEEIEKWIMEDVLPSIRKTGTYSMKKPADKQLEIYEYFDKTYKCEPVLSTMDVSHFTGINYAVIDWYARKSLKKGEDYHYLTGDELKEYKAENPKVSKYSSVVIIFTKIGFKKLCTIYNIKIETPQVFIDMPKTVTAAKVNKKECVDECVITLGVLGNVRANLKRAENYEMLENIESAIKYVAWELSRRSTN